jgi:hypothetical protein
LTSLIFRAVIALQIPFFEEYECKSKFLLISDKAPLESCRLILRLFIPEQLTVSFATDNIVQIISEAVIPPRIKFGPTKAVSGNSFHLAANFSVLRINRLGEYDALTTASNLLPGGEVGACDR